LDKQQAYINKRLQERQHKGNYRTLKPENRLVDLCSNDYLGFARSAELRSNVEEFLSNTSYLNGATGSRLLRGNTDFTEELEKDIAAYHGFEAGLIFNSGYDANVGLFSSLLQRGDTIITDELIHASIIDGIRMSKATRYKFKHNDLNSLKEKLEHATGKVYIAVESIYSMDGDAAPLPQIIELANQFGAALIVDEAHAVGIFGKGILASQDLQSSVFATIVTFGKALGAHGAIVLGSCQLRNYLINFARSFIYTTAAPMHQLVTIKMAYQHLESAGMLQQQLYSNICQFKTALQSNSSLISSNSAIQCLLIEGNQKTLEISTAIQQKGLDVRHILSPTVPAGTERLRICIHSFNTTAEITLLTQTLHNFIDHE
jgi:8-amino-7-oxononanoate synthase